MNLKKMIAFSLVLSALLFLNSCGEQEEEVKKVKTVKHVTAQMVKLFEKTYKIESVGNIKAKKEVSVVPLIGGTVQNVYFEEGDRVQKGQILARLSSATLSTNVNNALVAFNNAQASYGSVDAVTAESANQAEIALENARIGMESAELGVETAKDNYENGIEMKEKLNQDTITAAVINYESNLNAVSNAINQVNYLIKEDGNIQIPGIADVLGAKDVQSLNDIKWKYKSTKHKYEQYEDDEVTEENIEEAMEKLLELFEYTEDMVQLAIVVLDNTVDSYYFPTDQLLAQRQTYLALKNSIVSIHTNTKKTLDALENMQIETENNKESLSNAIQAAEKQLESTKVGYQNTLSMLQNSQNNRIQQLQAAKAAVDNAEGQLRLVQAQAAYLNVKAPAAGEVTERAVEIGFEVMTGQSLGKVSETEIVIVEVSLDEDEIGKIYEGKIVKINEDVTGTITKIYPAADPISKKTKVEIQIDNSDKKLLPNTTADVEIDVEPVLLGVGEGNYMVPLRAVTIGQSETYIFVYRDGRAVKEEVELGDLSQNSVVIESGLEDNDLLILEGSKRVRDGERVMLKK